jgi:hypothetical protein
MPKKGHAMFCNMSPKRENLFSGNKNPRFWDIKSRRKYFVASPENAKTFLPKTRIPDFGTSMPPFWRHFQIWCHFDKNDF